MSKTIQDLVITLPSIFDNLPGPSVAWMLLLVTSLNLTACISSRHVHVFYQLERITLAIQYPPLNEGLNVIASFRSISDIMSHYFPLIDSWRYWDFSQQCKANKYL